jgi:hypothetical protein
VTVKNALRSAAARFWSLVDSDSVRPFVSMYYIPWLLWALLATFLFPPVAIIETTMGHTVYVAWTWIAIPGTLASMAGLAMRHGGGDIHDMTTPLLLRDFMGLVLQATGHAVMCILLLLFEICAVAGVIDYKATQGVYAGMTILVAFLLSSYMVGTALLSLNSLRKLYKGEQFKRESS